MTKKYQAVVSKPCADCPFRKDIAFYLPKERRQEIAESLEIGESFTCHKTNDYDDHTGQAIVTSKSRHCAGAALILEAEGKPNQLMQVAQRLGYYTEPDGADLVFGSLEEFSK